VVFNVPSDKSKDLEDLCMLLAEYDISKGVYIRLFNKRFNTLKREVIVVDNISALVYVIDQTMKPNGLQQNF